MKRAKFQQLELIPREEGERRRAHGGVLAVGRRRTKRPLSTKHSLHVTLKSEYARNQRSLLRHQKLIGEVLTKACRKFGVTVYQKAICGTHIHLLIRGKTRTGIQNFFRVFAGHVAQGILRKYPLQKNKAPQGGCLKNQRRFWSFLTFSRLITWGREFRTVSRYVVQNVLEALNIIAYQPRKRAPS